MYTLSSKLRLFSFIIMALGIVGIVYGFITVPSSTADVEKIMASHDGGHSADNEMGEEHDSNFVDKARGEQGYSAETKARSHEGQEEAHQSEGEHLEHVLHQLQTRPWSATLIAGFFFMMIALGTLVFYAIQYASSAGWSPILYRVMEGITAYLLPGSIIVLLIVLFAGTHFYPWQDHDVVAGDKILQGKSAYLNFPFFVIRAIIYVTGWNLYRYFSRRNSIRQATAENLSPYKQNFKFSVFFLAFFIVTESMMSWDWFMSMTPHWYSTLFAWYIFASMIVSAVTTIAIVTILLKNTGHLEFVNDSHLHDLAKFMFGFSVFWTYLWFGQFLLIWYANIPEEVTYFILRIQEYNPLFFGMLILNFVFPILILMNSDYKRIPWFVVMAGVIILSGHYIDIFLLVMPSTVGTYWSFGITEIGAILFFAGLFILVVGMALASVSLRPERDPYIIESEHYHY